MFELFLTSALVGVFAGLLSGTLGLGGGVVVVPALLYVFATMGFDPETLAQQAVATSLATIVLTSVSATLAHRRLGNLRGDLLLGLGPGIAAGAFVGALVASALDGELLVRLFGALAILVAVQMFLAGRGKRPQGPERPPGSAVMLLCGSVIGAVAAMFGIGGGSMSVPLLLAWRVRIQQAVAVSAACGLPIAVAGCLGFLVTGWSRELPAGSVGFVYLPAVAGIVSTSFPMARIGARIAHRLPSATLKKMFSATLLLIGLKLVAD